MERERGIANDYKARCLLQLRDSIPVSIPSASSIAAISASIVSTLVLC